MARLSFNSLSRINGAYVLGAILGTLIIMMMGMFAQQGDYVPLYGLLGLVVLFGMAYRIRGGSGVAAVLVGLLGLIAFVTITTTLAASAIR